MAAWYVEERQARVLEGKRRRTNALIALAVAWGVALSWWGARNLLG